MKTNYKTKLLIISTLMVLASCSGGNNKNLNTQTKNSIIPVAPLSISAPSIIQLSSEGHNTKAQVLKVNNPGPDNYTLAAIYITDISGKEDQSHLLKISSNRCKTLDGNSSCSMKLKPKGNTSTAVVVQLILKNHDGKNQVLHQTIQINEKA